MINVTRLEELQRVIAALEWDIMQGQFNKRKAEYYKLLVKQRDQLLKSKTTHAYNRSTNMEQEVKTNESKNYRTDELEENQIVTL